VGSDLSTAQQLDRGSTEAADQNTEAYAIMSLAGGAAKKAAPGITVLYGRSQERIPGTPASTLAEIFMLACTTFKVDAASHTLRHKKKDLDLTLPLRLANLPAGAVAELCELDAAEAAARTVQVKLHELECIQLCPACISYLVRPRVLVISH